MKEMSQEIKEKGTFLAISLDDESIELLLGTIQKELNTVNDEIIKLKKDKLRLENVYENITRQRIDAINKGKKDIIKIEKDIIKIEKDIINIEKDDTKDESQKYIFNEISFDHSSLPIVKLGKNNIRRKDDKISIIRDGYKVCIRANIKDLIFLQSNSSKKFRRNAMVELSRNKQAMLSGILKDLDFLKLNELIEIERLKIEKDKENISGPSQLPPPEGGGLHLRM